MYTVAPRIEVPDSLVAEVRELFESNRPLQALATTANHPLERWPWGAAAVLAGRVIAWLGGDRAAWRLHILNYRHAPWHDEAHLYHLFGLQASRGVLASLRATDRLLRDHTFTDDPTVRFDVLAQRALLLSVFRDFPLAMATIDEAIASVPDRPWCPAIKAAILASADRRDEAIEWSDRALALRPGYRLAILHKADALIQLSRSNEAVAILEKELASTEVAAYAGLLQSIYSERDDTAAALGALDEWRQRQPLLDKRGIGFYHARRSDLLLRHGDFIGASEAASQADSHYHMTVAARLAEPGAADRRRVRLPVPFVRQHHITCAPATLASLAAFWNRPADHLEIAQKICYDGTSNFHQRSWAVQNGFAVAEFTVTYAVAKAIIDEGLPFALATVEPTSSHIQVLIGYDDRNGVVIMRDPTFSHFTEAIADPFFDRYAAAGPRGMLLVPADQSSRLDTLHLPDRHLYDLLYEMSGGLEGHRREEAGRVFDTLEQSAPGHGLVELARLSLATYDADAQREELAATRLHAMFPNDQWATFIYFRLHSRTAPHAESLALLDQIRLDKNASPHFELQRAFLLGADGRLLAQTEKSFRRFLRFMPEDTGGLSGLAEILAVSNRHAEALDVWRLAATVDDKDESTAGRYFTACLRLNREEEGLAFLRSRFDAHGGKSSAPAIALYQAYEWLERREEGFRVLDEALARRPDDGNLRLFFADAYGSVGQLAEARAALEAARPRVSRLQWLRRAASFSTRIEDNTAARGYWEDLLTLAPLDIDAQRAVVSYTAEFEGVDAALERLEALAAEHSDFHPLLELRCDWYLREGRVDEAIATLRHIIAIHPLTEWAHRGLSYALSRRGDHDEAIASARHAVELTPHLTYAHGQLGDAFLASRRFDEASDAFRRSLEISIDNAASMRGLLTACPDAGTRAEAIAFLRRQLASQITNGNGVRFFRDLARPHLDPAQLLAVLAEARAARPDLVETWAALVQEYIDRGEFEAADAEATVMLSRFPYALDTHRLRGLIEQHSGRLQRAEAAWREGLRVVPGWTFAMRCLGEALEGLGRIDDAVAIYHRAVAHSPLEAFNHGMLADVFWRTNRREEALASVRRAVLTEPGYQWGWQKLQEWAVAVGDANAPLEAARELTRRRPAETQSWLTLADVAFNAGDLDLASSAIEEGLSVSPANTALWDARAMALFRRGDLVGAIAACDPPVFQGMVPRELRGRRAWLLVQAGQPQAAGAEFDILLADQPDYAFAHFERYDLHLQNEDFAKARHHAEQLARLFPSDPATHGRVAETWIVSGNRDKAVPSLRRALHLDSSFAFALRHLLAHAIASDDRNEIEHLLSHIHRFCDSIFTLRCEVVARAAMKQKAALATAFVEFVRLDGVPTATSDEVVTAALGVDPKPTRATLEKAVAEGTVRSGSVVHTWVSKHPRRTASVAAHLRSSHLDPEIAAEGWVTLLVRLDATSIIAFLNRFRSDYQTNRLWSVAGARMAELGLRKDAGRWFADWQSRSDLEPWMIIEAIHSIEAASGPVPAAPLRRHLMASQSTFRDRYLHGIGLAWTEAHEGNAEAARGLLEGFDPTTIVAYYKAVFHFAHVLLAALPDGPPSRDRGAAIESHWTQAIAVCNTYAGDPALGWYKQLTSKYASADPEAAMLKRFAGRGFFGWLRSWW